MEGEKKKKVSWAEPLWTREDGAEEQEEEWVRRPAELEAEEEEEREEDEDVERPRPPIVHVDWTRRRPRGVGRLLTAEALCVALFLEQLAFLAPWGIVLARGVRLTGAAITTGLLFVLSLHHLLRSDPPLRISYHPQPLIQSYEEGQEEDEESESEGEEEELRVSGVGEKNEDKQEEKDQTATGVWEDKEEEVVIYDCHHFFTIPSFPTSLQHPTPTPQNRLALKRRLEEAEEEDKEDENAAPPPKRARRVPLSLVQTESCLCLTAPSARVDRLICFNRAAESPASNGASSKCSGSPK